MGGRSVNPRTRKESHTRPSTLQERISTASFKKALTHTVGEEIELLANQSFRQVFDDKSVRAAIKAWDNSALRAAAIAEAVVQIQLQIEKRLRKQRQPLVDLVDGDLIDDIEALLGAEMPSPDALEDLVAQAIRQEFVEALFADIIHSAIVSFNKRVNPLFGGIATSVLEDQIRGFIKLMMPMLQDQAISFVLLQSNRQIVSELSSSITRTILAQPLAGLVPQTSAKYRKRVQGLIEEVLNDDRTEAAAKRVMLDLWTDLYSHFKNKKIGTIFDPRILASCIAEPAAEILIVVLSRSKIAELLTTE